MSGWPGGRHVRRPTSSSSSVAGANSPAARRAAPAPLPADRPGDVVFSEEAVDDPRRLQADRVWIVDPLDGTREYGEPGTGDWGGHVAPWGRGQGLAARRGG